MQWATIHLQLKLQLSRRRVLLFSYSLVYLFNSSFYSCFHSFRCIFCSCCRYGKRTDKVYRIAAVIVKILR